MSEVSTAPTPSTAPKPVSRRRRGASLAGQVAGGAGLVISLLLILLVLVGRGWVIDKIDTVETSINTALGRATPVVATAQAIVTDVGSRFTELATAADAVAADTNATPAALVPLQERLSSVSERYFALRNTYAGFRADVVSVVDRLDLIRSVVPGDIVPQGPADALVAIDERIRALDEKVTAVINANAVEAAVDQKATQLATRAREAEASIAGVSEGLDAVNARVLALQAQVTDAASTVQSYVTLVTLVIILLLLYIAFLNLVLFRASILYAEPARTA